MANLIRFVYRGGTYTFPPQVSFDPHNGGAMMRTSKVPGMDGGLDEFGNENSTMAIGDIRVNWWLETAKQNKPMRDLRDDVLAMSNQVGMLVSDFEGSIRRTRARCNNIDINIDNRKRAHTMQQTQASFQIINPVWEAVPGAFYLNDGWQVGSKVKLPSVQYDVSISVPVTITLTNSGNAPAPILMVFKATPGTATALQVRHLAPWKQVLNGWDWAGSLAANESLLVDSRKLSVKQWTSAAINNVFSQFTEVTRAGFIELYPGVNTITVAGTTTAAVSLKIYYAMAWR